MAGCCNWNSTCSQCIHVPGRTWFRNFYKKICCCYEPWTTGETILEWADTLEKCPKGERVEAISSGVVIGVVVAVLLILFGFWGWKKFPKLPLLRRRHSDQEPILQDFTPRSEVCGGIEMTTIL